MTMLYRSERYLREFHPRALAAAARVTPRVRARVRGRRLARRLGGARCASSRPGDPRVVLVELSRNFGHHRAAVAGLAHARGRRVFMLDVDLEERPEWLPEFAAQMDAERRRRRVRREPRAQGDASSGACWAGVFWKLFNALSDVQMPENPCTVRLMSRRYVDALLTLPDRNLFLAGSYAWLGFQPGAAPGREGPAPHGVDLHRAPADRAVHRRRHLVHQLPAAPDLRQRRRDRDARARVGQRARALQARRSRSRSRSAGPRSWCRSGSSAGSRSRSSA